MTCAASSQHAGRGDHHKRLYSEALFAKVNCCVTSVQRELAVATSIGSSLMCVSRNEAAHWYGLWDLTMLLQRFDHLGLQLVDLSWLSASI